MTFLTVLLLHVVVGASAGSAQATALAATAQKAQPPDGVAPAISQKLSADGVRVSINPTTTLEFWWVSGLPIKPGANAASWAEVEEGSLVGAVKIPTEFRDIRGRIIKAGVYTLRYGIQPQNGDHLGVSPFRDFLLLSPVAVDQDPAPRGHDGTIEISKQSIGGSHPGVWSIDPPVASGAGLSAYKTELGHDAVIVEVPVVRDGKPSGSLKFGLVLIGKIEA